jgi:hypothetical protein
MSALKEMSAVDSAVEVDETALIGFDQMTALIRAAARSSAAAVLKLAHCVVGTNECPRTFANGHSFYGSDTIWRRRGNHTGCNFGSRSLLAISRRE